MSFKRASVPTDVVSAHQQYLVQDDPANSDFRDDEQLLYEDALAELLSKDESELSRLILQSLELTRREAARLEGRFRPGQIAMLSEEEGKVSSPFEGE